MRALTLATFAAVVALATAPARALDPAELLDLESVTCRAVALDGDTLLCRLIAPEEFAGRSLRVRLWGISAPEMRGLDGWGARGVLDEILAGVTGVERALVSLSSRVECRPRGRHKGRLVATCAKPLYPVAEDGTLDVDATEGIIYFPDLGWSMIAAGFATEHRVYTREGPHADPELAERYAEAEWDARRRRKGLWYRIREPLGRSK